KTAVDATSPGGATAIGEGLLAGHNEVTAAPTSFSMQDVLILLSDGMENVSPYYNTPSVKGVIEPTDTIIHTVAVGPPSAGHHDLLDTIASDNGGESYHINVDTTTTALLGRTAVSAGEGLDAWPLTLPNRIGDAYKQIAEEILGENRLFQAFNLADPKTGQHNYNLTVPEGLSRLTFALNWEFDTDLLRLTLVDPKGTTFAHDPQKPAEFCRGDTSHETCIIPSPEPGDWKITVQFLEGSNLNEYVVWASARTAVQFKLAVGTPVHQRIAGEPIHLLAFLNQEGKPLEARVSVRVYPPGSESLFGLDLHDDGQHGDGHKGDGIYAASFVAVRGGGPYAVRGGATGQDALGNPFTLYDNLNFHVKPRVLYVYNYNLETAREVESLLEGHSLAVDLAFKGSVPFLDLDPYSLVIIGPDTGYTGTWTPQAAINAITQKEIPVFGLGEGGYAYFGKRSSAIGYPNGAHGSGASILANHNTTSDQIWQYPYWLLNLSKEEWMLYNQNSSLVQIYLPQPVAGVDIFGFNPTNLNYANIVMENNWYLLWGFGDGPSKMNDEGKQLFVNTAHRLIK
ncbi:MAG: hypothetical protein P1S60_16150, partial [Anaerolineae bacterium]|nr:hypothetical protein [Anaerolineae bacterium]